MMPKSAFKSKYILLMSEMSKINGKEAWDVTFVNRANYQ